jgi:hypothetical protein
MNSETAALLVDLVEKVGLLRRDLQQKQDLERYAARVGRIDSKISALAERMSRDDAALAKALRTAWSLPARSLAVRNAGHQPAPPPKPRPKPKVEDREFDEGGES